MATVVSSMPCRLLFVVGSVARGETGIRKSGSRDTKTPLEELAVKDAMNAICKAQVRLWFAPFSLPLSPVSNLSILNRRGVSAKWLARDKRCSDRPLTAH